MTPDRSSPAENHDHASGEHPAQERVDPGTFAHQLFEHVANENGDVDADLFVSKIIAELFELSPIVREHVSDLVIADLVEELSRRDERDALRAVLEVQTHWSQEA